MTDDQVRIPPADGLDGPDPRTAPPELQELYRSVTAHTRVPYLGRFWRVAVGAAASPGDAWARLAPVLGTRAFEDEARALRRAALIEPAVEMSSHQAFKGDMVRAEIEHEMRERIGNYNHAAHYSLGKALLAAACVLRLTTGAGGPNGAAPAGEPEIPVGLAAGAVPVPPVAPAAIRGRTAELLDAIPAGHGHPVVDDYFLAIANAPDYLGAVWNAIKPVVRDEYYDVRGRELVQAAAAAAERLPLPADGGATLLAGAGGADARRAVLEFFATRFLPDLVIDLALIKGLHDGPEAALENRYDLE